MTGAAWALATAINVVILGAAWLGVAPWATLLTLGAVVGGWIVIARSVSSDAARLGEDGDRYGRRVIFFGWVGLVAWLVERSRRSPSTGSSPR